MSYSQLPSATSQALPVSSIYTILPARGSSAPLPTAPPYSAPLASSAGESLQSLRDVAPSGNMPNGRQVTVLTKEVCDEIIQRASNASKSQNLRRLALVIFCIGCVSTGALMASSFLILISTPLSSLSLLAHIAVAAGIPVGLIGSACTARLTKLANDTAIELVPVKHTALFAIDDVGFAPYYRSITALRDAITNDPDGLNKATLESYIHAHSELNLPQYQEGSDNNEFFERLMAANDVHQVPDLPIDTRNMPDALSS